MSIVRCHTSSESRSARSSLPASWTPANCDHHVEAAPLRDGPLDCGCDLALVGHVGEEDDRLPAGALDLGSRAAHRLLVAVDQADPGALGGEPDRGRPPHPHPGASDDRARFPASMPTPARRRSQGRGR
jgi:hypothetical protein